MDALLPGTSAGCTASLGGQLTGSNGLRECLATPDLIPVVGNGGSIVLPLEGWLDGMCPLKKCDQWAIDGAKTAITRDCGVETRDPASLVSFIKNTMVHYYPYREALCSQDAQGNWCMVQTANAIQNSTGTAVTLLWLQDLFAGEPSALQPVYRAMSTGALCTPCFAGIVATAKRVYPEMNTSSIMTCGSSFTALVNTSMAGQEQAASGAGLGLGIASRSAGLAVGGAAALAAYLL